tara:strand:+ start:116 stop:1519 length:1404 start_codon:yes stop_codon:yes gene_type:complete
MPLNSTTNIKLKLTTKTFNKSLSFTGLAVPQELKVNVAQPSYGNITIANNKIIKNNTTTISTSVASSGTSSEVTTANISSIIPYDKAVNIATVAISAASGYALANKPTIIIKSNNSGTKLFLKETTTANTYNIICVSSKANIRNFEAELVYFVTKTSNISNIINRITTDSTTVSTAGIMKDIKIYGAPNTPFNLFILDENDNSIINKGNSTEAIIPGIKQCLSRTLNKSGYFRYKQALPASKTIISTTVNGAVNNSNRAIFTSLAGVQVGDELLTSNDYTVKVLTLDPLGSNANQCDLTQAVTLSNSAPAVFKRGQTFKVHVTSSGSFKSTVNRRYPTITLNQYLNPLVKITASSANGSLTINGGSAGADDIQCFTGRPNRVNDDYNSLNTYTLTYNLQGVTSTIKANPASTMYTTTSGDSDVKLTNRQISGNATTNFTISFNVIVNTWGVADTNITIDLDNIIAMT